ncbi:MAG: acylphosphatase [Candidatus Binatia bacterium]
MTGVVERLHIVVSGRVQGVGFRYFTAAEARRLGLHGWVRNAADGSVEIVAAGSPARLRELAAWCRHGPPSARVHEVRCAPYDGDQPLGDFAVRR